MGEEEVRQMEENEGERGVRDAYYFLKGFIKGATDTDVKAMTLIRELDVLYTLAREHIAEKR